MRAKRIRQVNVLELDQAMYNSTYQMGLEMANWLNASMYICMLESKEQKEYINSVYGIEENKAPIINRNQVEDIIDNVRLKGELIDLGYSIDHFDENDSINDIFAEISIDESFSILGYNKSSKHKTVLKKLLKQDLGNPLMLMPMGKEIKNFHRIIVPFEPEYVTKKKLISLKWYADQLGVMVDFVHFKEKSEVSEIIRMREIYEVIFSWVDDLEFSSEVQFMFPFAENLNAGLEEYLANQDNYLVCIIDNEVKKSISTNNTNKECLTDIKEPLVIF